MKKITFCLLLNICISFFITTNAQVTSQSDTITKDVRRYVARNFSEARTLNLYWNKSLNHDYTLKQDGQKIEKGKMKEINAIKFSATVPILLLKNASIYANGQFNSYQFDTFTNADTESKFFTKNDGGYSFYEGSITGNYRLLVGRSPIILVATVFGDGWNKSFEKVSAIFSAITILKQSNTSSLSVGLYGTTLYDKLPVIPIIAYTRQLTPDLGIDVTLPSRAYLRYQFKNDQRVSFGASLNTEQFYMRTNIENYPKTSYFRKTTIRPEIVYEYIINNHFYLSARAGASQPFKSGIYKTNRKSYGGDLSIKYKEPFTPYFNIGCSYNIF